MVRRLRTRPILIATDLGRCAVYGSVPLASALGVLSLAQLFAVVTVAGVLAVFFEVGHQTYLPRLIPRDRLVEGNAKLQANISVAAVAAPSAGGFPVQYFGGAIAIAVNAATFVWSALWLRGIRTPERVPPRAAREPLWREIAEGLRFVFRHPVLRPLAEAMAKSPWSARPD